MSQSGVVAWSQTAASNGSADSNVNWAEGMAPSAVNNSARGQMASVAKYRDDTAGSLKTGGTTTAYTLSTNQVFSTLAYLSGQELTVRFDQANGASPTLNVDSLGAKAIQIDASTAVPAGFIAADSIWRLTYDNTIPAFILNGVSQAASYTTITTSGDATVGGDLSVAGDAAITGNATAATVTTTGDASVGGNLAATGNGSVGGNLTVTGTSTLTGAVTANNSAGITARNTVKAYAKFTQSGTTVSFTASTDGFNIASITRSSGGVYAVAFASALPTSNYAVIALGASASDQSTFGDAQSRTTSGFTLTMRGTSNLSTASDSVRCDFAVYGF